MIKQLYLLILLFPISLFAQDELHITSSCAFGSSADKTDYYVFDGSKEADNIIGDIMDVTVLGKKNFTIKSADCENALATKIGKERYILFNVEFIENFKKDAKNKWMAYCVFAHEVGHHLNNHDFDIDNSKMRRKMELEADKYAGGVLFRLGADLEASQYGIDIFCNEKASDTHPPRSARKAAIAAGWKQAQENHKAIQDRQENKEQPPEMPITKVEKEKIKKKPSQKPAEKPQEDWEDIEEDFDLENLTQVSDALFSQALIGNWAYTTNDGYNTYYYQTNLLADGTGVGYSYMNGVLFENLSVSWYMSGGEFILQVKNSGQTFRYTPYFWNQNTLALTLLGSNGPLSVSVGSIYTYSRVF